MKDKWDGLTKYKDLNRDWHHCPRCSKPSINKHLRKCMECNGHVAFYGDDCLITYYNDNLIHFYMWYKSVFGVEGWYDKSYFIQEGFVK